MSQHHLAAGVGLAVLGCLVGALSCQAGLGPLTAKPKTVSEEDWKNAKEKSTGDKDLRLADGGNYIGGIDRVWWLVVTGPPASKFHYHFAMLPAGNGTELKGTYEIKEGLAWFQGKMWKGPAQNGEIDTTGAGTPVRFALNYRHLGGKVYFNLLCKDAKGNYQYERRWFRADAKEWIPVERRTMTFTPQEVTDTQARFTVKAERTRWDTDGKNPKTDTKDANAVYENKSPAAWTKAPDQPNWLPPLLRPDTGKVSKDLPACFHLEGQHFGQVRGFTFDDPPAW